MGRKRIIDDCSVFIQKADSYILECASLNLKPTTDGLARFLGFKDRKSLTHYKKYRDKNGVSYKTAIIAAVLRIDKYGENRKRRQSRSIDIQHKVGQGYVYIIHCKDTSYYKIGISKNTPSNRLSNLQSGCPFELEMIYIKYCDHYGLLERQLHQRYYKYKIRGEWFDLTPSLLLTLKNDINEQSAKQLKLF